MNKAKVISLFALVIIICCHESNSARILGVFHMPASSHMILVKRLMLELANRGHQVTFINPLPIRKVIPNLTEIPVEEGAPAMQAIRDNDMFSLGTGNPFIKPFLGTNNLAKIFVNITFANANVQKLLKSDAKFDLVIMENFCNEALYVFGHHFKAPVVVMATLGSSAWTNHLVGNPEMPSYIPHFFLSYGSRMTFKERLLNSLFTINYKLINHFISFPTQNEILHQYFPDAPDVTELMYNLTSLILLNSNVGTNSPVPHVPNMVEIGGFHVQPPKALPKDLQDYLDGAKDGVIYFSMGSNLQSAKLPIEKREAILKVFSKLKQKVLWKWEDDNLPGQPKNVKTGKWLPQQDILAHPNVKYFISHGGLLSTIESIYHGVPMLGIPIFADQETNIAEAKINGYAVYVPYKEWSEESISNALNELISNPKYAETAKYRSKILQDQPLTPMDTAVFWIEYVIRHKGAYHLRTSAMDLRWYQYLLLDVIAFCIASIFVVFYIVSKIFSRIFRSKKSTYSPEKNGDLIQKKQKKQ